MVSIDLKKIKICINIYFQKKIKQIKLYSSLLLFAFNSLKKIFLLLLFLLVKTFLCVCFVQK